MRRVKSNLVTKDNQIPVLRATNKDHKEAVDKHVGPDVRPVMGAIVGPNIGLSEVASRIVRQIADNADIGLVAKSTEEVIEKFEAFNKERLERNLPLRGKPQHPGGNKENQKPYPKPTRPPTKHVKNSKPNQRKMLTNLR